MKEVIEVGDEIAIKIAGTTVGYATVDNITPDGIYFTLPGHTGVVPLAALKAKYEELYYS